MTPDADADGLLAPCDLCRMLTPAALLRPEAFQEWAALCPACWAKATAQTALELARDGPQRRPADDARRPHLYRLEGHTPVPEPDVLTWGRSFERVERHVAETWVTPDVRVSTVFLGVDHQWGHGPPLLFETMLFRAGTGEEMARYTTWDQAQAGHAAMVLRTQAALGDDA